MNRKIWLSYFIIVILASFSVYASWNEGLSTGKMEGYQLGKNEGFGIGESQGYSKGYEEGVEEGYSQALQDLLDKLRELSFYRDAPIHSGLPNKVEVTLFKNGATAIDVTLIEQGWHFLKKDGSGVYYQQIKRNIVLNQGVERINKIIYENGSYTGGASQYIGFSSVQYTPAYTDTSCTNLITTDGLDPQTGTIAHGTAANGDMQTNVTKTFTATGTVTATNMCLMWSTTAANTLAAVDITDASLEADDQLTAKWIANTTN